MAKKIIDKVKAVVKKAVKKEEAPLETPVSEYNPDIPMNKQRHLR